MSITKHISAALVLITCSIAPLTAEAYVGILFDSSGADGGGRVYSNQTDAVANTTAGRLPIGAICQLLWSSDATAGALNPLDPLNPTGGDSAIMNGANNYFTLTSTGRMSYDLTTLSDSYIGGYVYVRVFDAVSVGAIGAGTMYLEAPVWSATPSSITPAGPLQLLTADPTTKLTLDITPGGANIWLNQTIVPEPSVLAFLGIGAALVAVRRMRRS